MKASKKCPPEKGIVSKKKMMAHEKAEGKAIKKLEKMHKFGEKSRKK